MTYEWKDTVVLITGAATGIGATVVRLIVAEGTKHVAVLDIDESAGIDLQNELNTKFGQNKVKFYKCDVTNEDQLFSIFKSTKDDYDYIDVVINNAAIMNDRLHMYKKEIEINVTAPITGTLKAIEYMRSDKGGRGGTVINIASTAAITQTPLLPIYFGTKSAILQFSNCIGLDEYYLRTKVRVLAICFGATTTSLLTEQKLGSFDPDFEEDMNKIVNDLTMQAPENAARGLVDAYKQGKSGSTWLIYANKPAQDITGHIQKGYETMAAHVTFIDSE